MGELLSMTYEERKQRRIDRMLLTASKLREFAKGKDLSLYGEARSGIPLGQPILVGHHSERRHRRHLERIDRLVRSGYDALKKADELERRAEAASLNRSIASDNPDASHLLKARIEKLETQVVEMVSINKLVRAAKGNIHALAMSLQKLKPDLSLEKSLVLSGKLLTPDFCGRLGFAPFEMTNMRANIRRLQKRLDSMPRIQKGFEPVTIGDATIKIVDGWIHVTFPSKPSEETRTILKSEGFRWSPAFKVWGRKHTSTTANEYFLINLQKRLTL